MLYVEMDKADPILDDVLAGFTNKQPKIVASTVAALTALYHAYGVRIVEPKPAIKALPKLFSHADKNVRAEATNLTVELYRWLREAMKKLFWDELKPVQQTDLEKLFAAVNSEPAPKQERLLASQQAEAAVAAETAVAGQEEAEADEAEEEVEALDLAEPKDILSKMPSNFYESMASAKWKDRKEALDAVYAEVNTEKIKDGHFDELVAVLVKSMKDANIAVVTTAANIIEALAKGLRKSFAKFRGRTMPPVMEKLKEKKQSVTDALAAALDAVFVSSSLSECLEDILEFLKHKNPNVKAETLNFLIRCLKTTREVPPKAEQKAIAEAATKLLTDSVEATRSGGAEVLGTLMKIIGERAMNPYMDGLDDIRKTRIKEFCDKAEVKAKEKPKPVVAPPKASGPAATQRRAPPGATKKGPPGAGLKPPAKRAPSPQVEKATSPPSRLAPAKMTASKLGGLPKPGLVPPSSTGLKKKLPGAGHPPTTASPRRTITPHSEEESVPSVAPKLTRGLAGRPLGKPAPSSATPVATESPIRSASHSLTAADRTELDALRTESSGFQRIIDDLRADKTRLTAQIHELQNHNAELIEDHTRDVLSIKAKETQLVRARSDAEAAETSTQRLQRENDRLKRELSRSVRGASGPASPRSGSANGSSGYDRVSALGGNAGIGDNNDQIFRDSASSSGTGYTSSARPSVFTASSYDTSHGLRSSRYMNSPSEEKENGGNGVLGVSGLLDGSRDGGSIKPILGRSTSARTGNEPPVYAEIAENRRGPEEERPPMADWKRAGEVTSQLKARIEQMKVSLTLFLAIQFNKGEDTDRATFNRQNKACRLDSSGSLENRTIAVLLNLKVAHVLDILMLRYPSYPFSHPHPTKAFILTTNNVWSTQA